MLHRLHGTCECIARWGRSSAEAVNAAVHGGATIVQVREKDVDGGAFLEQAGGFSYGIANLALGVAAGGSRRESWALTRAG